ncbi:MAG: hypothetical protein IKG47_02765 [Oscillospiraceae bacterium]|nr:hypothetical protein [Oscillospiraceae bacterium]
MYLKKQIAAALAAILYAVSPAAPAFTYALPDVFHMNETAPAFSLKITDNDETLLYEKTSETPLAVEIYNYDMSIARSAEYSESVTVQLKPAEISGHNFIGWTIKEEDNVIKVIPEYEQVSFDLVLKDRDENVFYSKTSETEIELTVTDRAGIIVQKQMISEDKTLKLTEDDLEGYLFQNWNVEEGEGTVKVSPVYREIEKDPFEITVHGIGTDEVITAYDITEIYTFDPEGNALSSWTIDEAQTIDLEYEPEEGKKLTGWTKTQEENKISYTAVVEALPAAARKISVFDSEGELIYETETDRSVILNYELNESEKKTIVFEAGYDAGDEEFILPVYTVPAGMTFKEWHSEVSETEDMITVNISAVCCRLLLSVTVKDKNTENDLIIEADPGMMITVYKDETTPGETHAVSDILNTEDKILTVEHKEFPGIAFAGWRSESDENGYRVFPVYDCSESYMVIVVDALTGEEVFADKYEHPTMFTLTDKEGEMIFGARKIDKPYVIYVERSMSDYTHTSVFNAFTEEMTAYKGEHAGRIINAVKTEDEDGNVTAALEFADTRGYTVTYKDQYGGNIVSHKGTVPVIITVLDAEGKELSCTEHSGNSIIELTPAVIAGKTFLRWTVAETDSGYSISPVYETVKPATSTPVSATITAKVRISEADKSDMDPQFYVTLKRANSSSGSYSKTLVTRANGRVSFPSLKFGAAGTYSFDIYLENLNDPYYRLEINRHRIIFTVKENDNGQLTYTMTMDGKRADPENIILSGYYIGSDRSSEGTAAAENGNSGMDEGSGTYTSARYASGNNTGTSANRIAANNTAVRKTDSSASKAYSPASISFTGRVTLKGKELKKGDFTIVLMSSDGKIISTAENQVSGVYTITTGNSIAKPGIYTFTISEKAGNTSGYIYSKEKYTVKVKAVDDGHGSLDLSIESGLNSDGSGADFSNEYKMTAVAADNANKGSIKITTTVSDETKAEREHSFHYRLVLEDKTINGKYGGVEFKNGEGTFNLKHSESVTVTGIPENTRYYIYQEGDEEDYSTSVIAGEGTVRAGKTAYAYFRNTKISTSDTSSDSVPEYTGTDYYVPTQKDHLKYMIPWLVLGGIAVTGGAGYFIYRKREEEYADYEDDDEEIDYGEGDDAEKSGDPMV